MIACQQRELASKDAEISSLKHQLSKSQQVVAAMKAQEAEAENRASALLEMMEEVRREAVVRMEEAERAAHHTVEEKVEVISKEFHKDQVVALQGAQLRPFPHIGSADAAVVGYTICAVVLSVWVWVQRS